MLMYNYKDIISVGFKKESVNLDENYEETLLNLINHRSYVDSIEELIIETLDCLAVIECDYCGKKIHRKGRSGADGKLINQNYIDENSEYPCTNYSCVACHGKKSKILYFEKYGVTYNVNAMKSREESGHVPTSRPQRYLANLLKAELNTYFKDIGYVDIVLERDKVVIEYDGSGHFLGEQFGRYTYEEKLNQDYERDLKLRELGYKVIRIESKYDYIPSDETIVKEIENIKSYFDKSGKEFFKWVIPSSKKDNRYGILRKITNSDVKTS